MHRALVQAPCQGKRLAVGGQPQGVTSLKSSSRGLHENNRLQETLRFHGSAHSCDFGPQACSEILREAPPRLRLVLKAT